MKKAENSYKVPIQGINKSDNVRNKLTKSDNVDVEEINKQKIVQQQIIDKILADRKQRIEISNKYNKLPISQQTKETISKSLEGTPDKFRLFPEDAHSYIDELINPGVWVGNMAKNLAQSKSVKDYALSIGEPLLGGALGFSPIDNIINGSKNLTKDAAIKIMSSSSYNKRNPKEIIKALFSKRGDYIGGDRDLISLYVKGNEKGFVPSTYTLDKGVPKNIKAYKMDSAVPDGAEINWEHINKHLFKNKYKNHEDFKNALDEMFKEKNNTLKFEIGKDVMSGINSPVNPMDDVAGHMVFLNKHPETGAVKMVTRDLWGFNPKAYDKRYNMNSLFHKLQSTAANKIGNPFVLVQENPITFNPAEIHETVGNINSEKIKDIYKNFDYDKYLKKDFDTNTFINSKFENGGTIMENEMKNGGTIHIDPKNKGKFNALKERTGKSTEELTHSKNPLTRKRAIFAQNAAKWKHELGGQIYAEDEYIAKDGFNFQNYFPMERDIPMDTISSYNRDIDKFAWRNTLQGDYNLKQLQSQQQLPQQIDSSYFLQKTPKGYSNVYDKSNRLIGYSMDNKTIVKQEPNFEDGGMIQAWIQKFSGGGEAMGGNTYFNRLKTLSTNPDSNSVFNADQLYNTQNPPNNSFAPRVESNLTQPIGTGFYTNYNATDKQVRQDNKLASSMMGEDGSPMGKAVPILNGIGAAGDAVIQGGGAIASLVGDESAGRALQKAGEIGKVAESFGNIIPVPGAGRALGAVASIFAAPFTAWGEHIATVERAKGQDDADFHLRNSAIMQSNNPYGNQRNKYGGNIKNMQQRVIDDIYSDFDKYMKLT